MNLSALVDDGTWRRRRWASFGGALLLMVMLIPVSQARAESLGCVMADRISATGVDVTVSGTFDEGELVTVKVTTADGATLASLTVNGSDGGSTPVPGAIQYSIPSTGNYTLSASADATATFDIDCTVGDTGDPGDPGDPSSTIPPSGDYCDSGKAFGKHVSATARAGEMKGKMGYKPGSDQGFSACKDGD